MLHSGSGPRSTTLSETTSANRCNDCRQRPACDNKSLALSKDQIGQGHGKNRTKQIETVAPGNDGQRQCNICEAWFRAASTAASLKAIGGTTAKCFPEIKKIPNLKSRPTPTQLLENGVRTASMAADIKAIDGTNAKHSSNIRKNEMRAMSPKYCSIKINHGLCVPQGMVFLLSAENNIPQHEQANREKPVETYPQNYICVMATLVAIWPRTT